MPVRQRLEEQGRWLFRWRSYLPLLVLPILIPTLRNSESLERAAGSSAQNFWEIFCFGISLVGLGIRCVTVGHVPAGTSGRNTKGQKAATLNTTGMYSIVRHPVYLGNLIITLGLVLFVGVWWFFLIVLLAFWLYYERIILAEEVFLQAKFGSSYLDWAEKTSGFLPRFKNWQRPSLLFSVRSVLRREYSTIFLIVVCANLLDAGADLMAEGKLELDLGWLALLIIASIAYLTLRTMKKKTAMLDVVGR